MMRNGKFVRLKKLSTHGWGIHFRGYHMNINKHIFYYFSLLIHSKEIFLIKHFFPFSLSVSKTESLSFFYFLWFAIFSFLFYLRRTIVYFYFKFCLLHLHTPSERTYTIIWGQTGSYSLFRFRGCAGNLCCTGNLEYRFNVATKKLE